MSFLPNYCQSFRITVIHFVLLSFISYYCHSFRIIVILSVLLSFLPNIVIPSKLLSLPLPIFVILNSSCTLPYPKGEKIGRQSRPYLRVGYKLNCHQPVTFASHSAVFETESHFSLFLPQICCSFYTYQVHFIHRYINLL